MKEWVATAVDVDHDEALEPEEWALWMVPEWDELLSSSLEIGASLLRARKCALFLFLDHELEKLVLTRLWDEAAGALSTNWEATEGDLEWEVARSGEPVVALRPGDGSIGARLMSGGAGLYPCACAVVEVGEKRFGVVEMIREAGDEPFLPTDLHALQLVANQLALYLRNGAIHRRISHLANTDGLTGVYNYRYFQERLATEVDRAARYGRPLSLIMLDLNHFKRYNDNLGHQQGDVALRITASTIQRAIRRIDLLARYGGDEFAIILPETANAQALVVATRVSHAVRDQAIPTSGKAAVEPLSVSIGISSYPTMAQSTDELIAQADEALYRAKRGRVRTIRLWKSGWRRRAPAGAL